MHIFCTIILPQHSAWKSTQHPSFETSKHQTSQPYIFSPKFPTWFLRQRPTLMDNQPLSSHNMLGVYCCSIPSPSRKNISSSFVELPLLHYVYVILVQLPITILNLSDHRVKRVTKIQPIVLLIILTTHFGLFWGNIFYANLIKV